MGPEFWRSFDRAQRPKGKCSDASQNVQERTADRARTQRQREAPKGVKKAARKVPKHISHEIQLLNCQNSPGWERRKNLEKAGVGVA